MRLSVIVVIISALSLAGFSNAIHLRRQADHVGSFAKRQSFSERTGDNARQQRSLGQSHMRPRGKRLNSRSEDSPSHLSRPSTLVGEEEPPPGEFFRQTSQQLLPKQTSAFNPPDPPDPLSFKAHSIPLFPGRKQQTYSFESGIRLNPGEVDPIQLAPRPQRNKEGRKKLSAGPLPKTTKASSQELSQGKASLSQEKQNPVLIMRISSIVLTICTLSLIGFGNAAISRRGSNNVVPSSSIGYSGYFGQSSTGGRAFKRAKYYARDRPPEKQVLPYPKGAEYGGRRRTGNQYQRQHTRPQLERRPGVYESAPQQVQQQARQPQTVQQVPIIRMVLDSQVEGLDEHENSTHTRH
ncbi:hypothetical protein AMATHDRAFT_6749 [Amanita thiersii Skay4041]|uniref:Uncharacterized protein n=1 Tax=Amanita thiersii Skay4041 TaxID=703135 RepID=A0A2A9NGR8_9AGAR|nr:hypothetical protein AMATHDRAFT_6749 [Amanita thiersii Skay4041]